MDAEGENEEPTVGDSASTPVQEVHEPSPTSREEPLRAIGPTLNKERIVQESLDIIDTYSKKITEQKHYMANMGFMMHSMSRLLDSSREHEERLQAFFVYNEKLHTPWFLTIHDTLPSYGDYTLALQDVPDVVVVDGLPSSIKQSVLKDLAVDVVQNLHTGGWQVKAQRQLDRQMEAKLKELTEVSAMDAFPFYLWLTMIAKEIGHQDRLEKMFFEVSSYLDFLNYSSIIETDGDE